MKRTNLNNRLKRTLQTVLAAAALAGAGASAQAQFGPFNVSPMGGAFGMGRLGGPLVIADFSGGANGYAGPTYAGYVAPYAFPTNAGANGFANFGGTFTNPSLRATSTPGTGLAFNSLATGPNFGTTDPLFGFQQGRVVIDPVTGLALQQSPFPVRNARIGAGNSLVDFSNSFAPGTIRVLSNTGAQTGLTQQTPFTTSAVNGGIRRPTFVDISNSFPPGVIHIDSLNGSPTGGLNFGSGLNTNTSFGRRPGFVELSNSFPPGVIHIDGIGGFSLNNAIRAGVNFGAQSGIFPTATAGTTSFGLTTSLPRR